MSQTMQDGAPTIGQAMDAAPWSAYQKMVLVLAALAFCVDGLANQTLSLALPALTQDWGVSRNAFSNVQAVGLVGVLIGNAVGGIIGDRFGRRTGMIGTMLLFGAATAACSQAQDLNQIMIFRAIAGLGIGGMIPSGAAMIAEFTPLRSRAWAIAIGMVFIPVGSVLAGQVAEFVLPRYGWQGLFITDGALPLVCATLFLFVLPESPRFLARRPERKAGLLKLLARCGVPVGPQTRFVEDAAEQRAPLATLFGVDMRRDTLLLWSGFFFILLANYMVLNWAPTLVSEQGYPPYMIGRSISAFSFGGIVGGVACGWVLEKYGSRVAVPIVTVGALVFAVALAFFQFDPSASATPLLLLLSAEGFFLAALHTMVYAMAATVYPTVVRATGVGSAAAFGRLGAIASSYSGVIAMDMGGPRAFFVFIMIMLALACASIFLIRRQVVKS